MFLAISAVICGGSCSRRQHAALLVIANGDDLYARFFRQFSDAHEACLLDPIATIAFRAGAMRKLWLVLIAAVALAQAPEATIRIAVKSDAGPVQGADVTAGGKSAQTGPDGVAVLPAVLGLLEVSVTKEGFFPAQASLNVDAARQWPLEVELQPQKEKQEEVTVYATRTDTRLQDSPLHVEVVSQDEINEELAMRPGDIGHAAERNGRHARADHFPGPRRGQRADAGHAGPLYGVSLRWAAPLRTAGRRAGPAANSADGFRAGRSHQGQRFGALRQLGNGRGGESHLAQAGG